jgi:hypothetical protein
VTAPAIDALLLALQASWGPDTSRFPGKFSALNPACGQCYVSSLVIQDYLGGDIQRFAVVDAGEDMRHVANVLPGGVLLDSTASQFTSIPVYVPITSESREDALAWPGTAARYEILSDRVAAALGVPR